MASGGREEAHRRRAEARERRRKQSADAPNEKGAGHSSDGDSTGDERLAAVKQAAKTAVAGAAVGAAAAAARKLARGDREHERSEDASVEAAQPRSDEPRSDEQQQEREPEPRQEREPEPQPAAEAQPEPEPPAQDESRDDRPPGASPSEAGEAVRQAREQLEALLGRRPESVSAMERTHDGWLVTVEVVEVARIPESTDVLASYEIELDGDRNLRRYARVRRYHRSQADQGGGA